jgi:hypothetical protein
LLPGRRRQGRAAGDVSQFRHGWVGAGPADQAFAGRLAEGQPELDARHGGDQRLVDVLDRLDEVRLAQDEVGVVGLLDLHGLELHVAPLIPGSLTLASWP